MLEIAYLADHPEMVHTLADWFKAEWSGYYANDTHDDVVQQLSDDLNHDHIPIRLIALDDGNLAGSIVLREQALSSQPNYTPGLGGLFVHEFYRKRGIATELVRAATKLAYDLGYPVIYTSTNSARGIVERLGWEYLGKVVHPGEVIGLYRKRLDISEQ